MPDDPQSMAASIARFIDDPEYRRRVGDMTSWRPPACPSVRSLTGIYCISNVCWSSAALRLWRYRRRRT